MAALTNTTLAADAAASDTILKLTSTSGYPAAGNIIGNNNNLMQINGEQMYFVELIASGTVRVRNRGSNGTLAVAHDILSSVSMGAPADFPADPAGASNPRPPYVDEIVHYGEDGAIAVPNKNSTILLNKATAGAFTLAAPTLGQNGVKLTIINETAAAHVITATTLLADAVSGSPHTTATFAAFKGASLTLEAANGLWNVVAAVVCPIT